MDRPTGGLYVKTFRPEVKEIDTDAGAFTAVLSNETKDGDGDVIRQSGWDLARFRSHPVMLSSHNYRSLRDQIGHWENVKVANKELTARGIIYRGEGNPEADWAWNLAQKSRLAFSVGFIPDMERAAPIDKADPWGGFEFKGQELLEVSAVTVPSNGDALQRMKELNLPPVIAQIVDEELRDIEPEQVATKGAEALASMIADALVERVKAEAPAYLKAFGQSAIQFVLTNAAEPAVQKSQESENDDDQSGEPVAKAVDFEALLLDVASEYLQGRTT